MACAEVLSESEAPGRRKSRVVAAKGSSEGLGGAKRVQEQGGKGFLAFLDEPIKGLLVHVEHGFDERSANEGKNTEGQ